MKKYLMFAALSLSSCFNLYAQSIIVGTFNIRYDNPRDSGNLWVDRKAYVASLIRFHDFDVFGTQEGLKHQLDDIQQQLPQYERYGIGRDDGATQGEYSAIFYKKDKYQLIKSGDFWLSETPDKPGFGWDARINRICSWVQLKDKASGQSFFCFNVHFDHQGVVARKESSKLLLSKMQSISGKEPVIITGDFNGDHTTEWYQTLANSGIIRDSFREVQYPYVNNGSFQNFGRNFNTNDIIDHIFISSHFNTKRWGVLTDSYSGKFPSDHFPILTELHWKK
ncbi:MAG: endonuclease/exonuclease/phosphatase family protein [Chitinophagaceae bacterium]|jgi:endonuclease/exonuclease/phosphatase family metal-dependent hydrolase|uniref:endonuclease/exonuclease/phosphatase family protein n=1 Tax=unclassified Sediminibacterium TaxID=2635961 RepID=UPI0015C03075|nr:MULTISPECIES: endonuclease/exonuclease/phosphatase family protein [unclassified Sediminibacterium]MBS4063808.1 endonuclease/exonuclease/phosphatase family protein [Chitinophagaceae bacterium]MBW0165844.1 endonuclease/exonuclease/phosphatase family protein [Sediminibacterium sp.]MDZ4072350.1 endonuclease/exonuclease/phosphatase family protein [Sediminibacterium sp.]NWK64811.1 endonuclease/exonuclease/phosphatase family protein [Sediminibacterium sp. Gen4]